MQLDKIEQKAMNSFTTSHDHDVDEIDLDAIVAKQLIDLKYKLGIINVKFDYQILNLV